jgi:hypothetical protein
MQNALDVMTAQDYLCFACDERHDFVYIDPKCHPEASIQAAYNRASKLLRIECLECGREVVMVRVTSAAVAA